MKVFLNRFTSRMVLGEIVIHAAIITGLFFLALPLFINQQQSHFAQQASASTQQLIFTIASNKITPQQLATVTKHQSITFARMLPEGTPNPDFREDRKFGGGNDHTYYLSDMVIVDGASYTLQLGFDETSTNDLIYETQRLGIYAAVIYLVVTLLSRICFGSHITGPLRQLRHAASNISAKPNAERLTVNSSISEIKELTTDLDRMRAKLVAQREDLAIREARITSIMDNVADVLITINDMGNIQSFNLAAERIFGYSAEEVVDQSVNTLFAAPLVSRNQDNNGKPITIEEVAPYETLGRRKDGSIFHLEASISEVCEIAGCISVVVCRDITATKQAESEINSLKEDLEQRVVKRTRELASVNKELQHQALHDALTSLPNRVLLQDRLQQATRAAKREGHSLALMITDLDRFKEINDTLGHHYGDLLLQQVAVRVRASLRDSDTVARLGGDEFAVLLPAIQHDDQAIQAAMKISKAMEAPFILENQHFHVGISIGIAMYPKDGEESAHLMRRADVAMYVSKRSQHEYSFYSPEQDQHSASRLAMASELRIAMEEKQLHVKYQPTVDLKTKKVIGVEALLRWQHPEKGTILPNEFIPLAEQTGMIKSITSFVLEESLQQLHLWHSSGLNLRMAINLSARNLSDPELAANIATQIERWRAIPQQVQLEITESAIMEDTTRAMNTLSRLSAMGIKLSIDDFGTGYSSLAYLKQLPVQEIKIDRSFVEDMLMNNEDKVIVRSTIDLAHNMGHSVIAEGANNDETITLLTEMGCDMAQGYFICTPLSATEVMQWLKTNGTWEATGR
ncbi:EAL domain-containing protein [Pseudomonadota bacterium]